MRRLFRVVGWGVLLVPAAVFLVGYTAPYLPPEHFWWTDLFAVFVPPLALFGSVVGIGCVLYGARRRAWTALVGGIALLVLIVVRFGPAISGESSPSGREEALTVMTYNLPPTPNPAATNPSPVSDLVQSEAPHVIALQESWLAGGPITRSTTEDTSPSLRGFVADSLGYGPPRAVPRTPRIYQPVLGRIPLDSLQMYGPEEEESDSFFRYTRTRFRWDDRQAVLYNVHLHTVGQVRPWRADPDTWLRLDPWVRFFDSYRTAALRRAKQARAIRSRIEREQHPVIVAGDFNSTPHQWAFHHIADGLQYAVQKGAWEWTATFPARRPLVQIDHVLADPAWAITDTRVPALKATGAASDHRPLVVGLQWRE